MFESAFITINEWISSGTGIAALGCFLWGVISVIFSPCHLASIPLIIAYVGGQKQILKPGQASVYAAAFTTGLFITIALVGIICAFLGRMMGDIGNYWQIMVGAILIWVALGMMGVDACQTSGNFLHRLNLKGVWGAFILGLSYGILSGSCTFGFIAPILAIITVQEKIAVGVMMIFLFAVGHCLPIAISGSSTAVVKKFLENTTLQGAGNWFRKCAGVMISLLGIYFIIRPFIRL
ncbi:MAG: cytochrome c biogenesis protein CcdA [Proteobacteria bacterium]|nr:cytochrome c biogenesis protein CcdA [Pseudomonadota bacterium]